jgi:hypothetical protein
MGEFTNRRNLLVYLVSLTTATAAASMLHVVPSPADIALPVPIRTKLADLMFLDVRLEYEGYELLNLSFGESLFEHLRRWRRSGFSRPSWKKKSHLMIAHSRAD